MTGRILDYCAGARCAGIRGLDSQNVVSIKSSENLHKVQLGTQQDVIKRRVDYCTIIGCSLISVNKLVERQLFT